jgi:NADH dehydrogenase [ubiquinone] 1 alpha subcomplex assembly factor 3
MLSSEISPPVQVNSISEAGIQLADGLLLPSSCVFLEGNVYLWDVPAVPSSWSLWTKEHFELFETVVPRPELLLFGTGKRLHVPPPFVRSHLKELGIGLEVLDTRNACSTYNLLSEEGRRVAAALLPLEPKTWSKEHAR